ncbi:MAG: hypothetical protein ACLTTH_12430 [Holdemanella porci]
MYQYFEQRRGSLIGIDGRLRRQENSQTIMVKQFIHRDVMVESLQFLDK